MTREQLASDCLLRAPLDTPPVHSAMTFPGVGDGRTVGLPAAPASLLDIFTHTTMPMLLTDDDRCFLAGNAAVLELLNCDADGLVRMRIDDIAPAHLREHVPAMWAAFIAEGTMTGAFTVLRADGEPVDVDFNATANIAPGQHLSIFIRVKEKAGLPSKTAKPAANYQRKLSDRERQVLRLVALGKTGDEIASALAIAPGTVRVHVRNSMHKLGARTRAQAVGTAISLGDI